VDQGTKLQDFVRDTPPPLPLVSSPPSFASSFHPLVPSDVGYFIGWQESTTYSTSAILDLNCSILLVLRLVDLAGWRGRLLGGFLPSPPL